MHFLPAPGYTGETGNGIHEIAGGLDSGGTFGSPVSLGCIRLNKFQAKLARWWIPRQAKFFVYFEPSRYRHFGDAATGKAKGSQSAAPYSPPTASYAQANEDIFARRPERSQLPEFPLFPWLSLSQR